MSEKIKILLIKKGMKLHELATLIGDKNSTNLSNKLKRDNFNEDDLQKIAEALNCDYEGIFTLRDTGEKV